MTEPSETSTALVLPSTGELVDLNDERQVAKAYAELQVFAVKLSEASRTLRSALAERSRLMGTKTFHVPGVGKVEVKGGSETLYDAEALEKRLRDLGMPEERISEIVVQVVTHKVDAREAKKAAGANEEYAAALEAVKQVREKTPSISISR